MGGIHRNWPLYFLTEGIYGDWAIFQKPIHSPQDEIEAHYSERQESTRKDVKRFNGCLQGRFKILRHESFEFDDAFIVSISNRCNILHNMLAELRLSGELEDEYDIAGNRIRDEGILAEFIEAFNSTGLTAPVPLHGPTAPVPLSLNGVFTSFMDVYDQITDRDVHEKLTNALADHLWDLLKMCSTAYSNPQIFGLRQALLAGPSASSPRASWPSTAKHRVVVTHRTPHYMPLRSSTRLPPSASSSTQRA